MKTFLTIIPEMYADWMATSWSMLLGQPPKGLAMEPKLDAAQVAVKPGRADTGASVQRAKKSTAKPAAKKPTAKRAANKSAAKRAARKSTARPATKVGRGAAPAKRRRRK